MKQIKFIALIFALFSVFAQTAKAQQDLNVVKNNINAAYDALSRKDWQAFAALCADNYTDVNVGPGPTVGIQAAIGLYQQFAAGFPDFKVKPSEIVAAGNNRYYVRVTVSGTNTGSFMMLPPTGKAIKFEDTDILELDKNGKCIRHTISNPGESMRQIGYGSMIHPNTQAIIAVYEKFGKGDVPGILDACSDAPVFDIQDRMFDSKQRLFKGKAEVGQFFQELGSKFQYTKFQPIRFVTDGDDVFILVEAAYKHIPTGKMYTSTYTHHFRVVNGKVAYFRGLDDFQQMK